MTSPPVSNNLLVGKTVIITGCATGIGAATAVAAARNGASLVLHHLGESTAREMQQVQASCSDYGAKSVIVEGDISDAATAEKIVSVALSTFPRIDCLVSNAGICTFHPFLTLPGSLWQRTQDVNLSGAFYITQAVARVMSTQEPIDGERGCVVAMSSISALMGGGEQVHYTPTKAGVKSLMESCAIALGEFGIRCNSVLPGTIVTNLNRAQLADPATLAAQEGKIPSGRVGLPDDVADPVIFLCSRLARYINGASLLVDGGWNINAQ